MAPKISTLLMESIPRSASMSMLSSSISEGYPVFSAITSSRVFSISPLLNGAGSSGKGVTAGGVGICTCLAMGTVTGCGFGVGVVPSSGSAGVIACCTKGASAAC